MKLRFGTDANVEFEPKANVWMQIDLSENILLWQMSFAVLEEHDDRAKESWGEKEREKNIDNLHIAYLSQNITFIQSKKTYKENRF